MRYLACVLLCIAVGCSAPDSRHGGSGGSGGSTGGGGSGGLGGGGSGGLGGGGSGGGGGGNGCSAAAMLIYTIDNDGTFSSFTPNQTDVTKSVFTDLGTLKCPVPGGLNAYTPFSMSVDRSGTAWVEYVDQAGGSPNLLFKVSTTDASCQATTFKGNQQGMNEFGMGFVSDTPMGTTETLYIGGGMAVGSPSNLGTLDVNTFMITKGGSLSGDPELTGTGLAELWGFFPDASNPRISKIDKMSGAESNTIKLGQNVAGNAADWAFAFYGGDFWVFLAKQQGGLLGGAGATTVYHVTSSGLKDQLDTMTRHIVGAGVSTCAPTTPIG